MPTDHDNELGDAFLRHWENSKVSPPTVHSEPPTEYTYDEAMNYVYNNLPPSLKEQRVFLRKMITHFGSETKVGRQVKEELLRVASQEDTAFISEMLENKEKWGNQVTATLEETRLRRERSDQDIEQARLWKEAFNRSFDAFEATEEGAAVIARIKAAKSRPSVPPQQDDSSNNWQEAFIEWTKTPEARTMANHNSALASLIQ